MKNVSWDEQETTINNYDIQIFIEFFWHFCFSFASLTDEVILNAEHFEEIDQQNIILAKCYCPKNMTRSKDSEIHRYIHLRCKKRNGIQRMKNIAPQKVIVLESRVLSHVTTT